MRRLLKRQSSYLFLIIISIIIRLFYSDDIFYFGVKYITSFRAIDMMISILFTFSLFKVYLDNYYYMVLNRINIITRIGVRKYNLLIIKILLLHSFLIIFINSLLDFLLIGRIKFVYLLLNALISCILVIVLPKRKEYNYELVIIMIVFMIIKLIVYHFFYDLKWHMTHCLWVLISHWLCHSVIFLFRKFIK